MGRITVLAGTNGAGKSSIGGELLLKSGGVFFNPDHETREILRQHPNYSLEQANELAWNKSAELLRRAIEENKNYRFETTLGGKTITSMLIEAAKRGLSVHVWYCGLSSPDLHIQRVAERVQRGGHDIPEGKIRERYESSRRNLIRLLPDLDELRVYDNSRPVPQGGTLALPTLLLALSKRRITHLNRDEMQEWAKPIAAAAMGLYGL